MKTETKLIQKFELNGFRVKVFWKKDRRSRKTYEIVVDNLNFKFDPTSLDVSRISQSHTWLTANRFKVVYIDRYSIVVKKREDALNFVTELLLIL